jgi:hypothetical protein
MVHINNAFLPTEPTYSIITAVSFYFTQLELYNKILCPCTIEILQQNQNSS